MRFDQVFLSWTGLAGVSAPPQAQATNELLPFPRELQFGAKNSALVLAPELKLDAPESEVIANVFDRKLNRHCRGFKSGQTPKRGFKPKGSLVDTVRVEVADLHADLQHGIDESYILTTSSKDGIEIAAETVWGVVHAFTTLEQLLVDNSTHWVLESEYKVSDGPGYAYRGVHIDTARNFYTVESLKRQIDAMSLAKMNVFHWHLTDSQAWPVEIDPLPAMTNDAYSEEEIYTVEDIREIVDYAYQRAVRVVPELDMPGHSAAGWKQLDPDYCLCVNEDWETTAVEPTPGHLNILNPGVYTALSSIYNQVSELFRDDMFHVGFDELNIGCYKTDKRTMEWLGDGRDWSDLAQYWVDKTQPIFLNTPNRRLMMWQDSVTSEHIPAKSIPKDTILQAWSGGLESVKNLTAMGYDVVVSSADFLYLDCGFGNWVGHDVNVFERENQEDQSCSYNYGPSGGSWCGPFKTWQRLLAIPLTDGLTDEEAEHVIGASTALWSEQSDYTNVDQMIWPRTAALAELLWSGNNNADELLPRILRFRERLVKKGINASPLMPKWCLNNPHQCISS